jgi:acyl-CoA thioesterase-1
MNWLIHFFGSGTAFFSGVGFVLAAIAFLCFCQRKWAMRSASLVALFGLILIALSATPLPYWFYGIAGMVSLLWLVAERSERKTIQKSRRWFRLTLVLLWSAGTLAEVPYHIAPTLKPAGRPTLYIFADSVTAGMGENSIETWPNLLARSHSIDVQDHSQMGAKVGSMLRKVEKLSIGDGIVLLEIGGNDLLGSTPATEFERDLDQLLAKVCRPGRTVIMFELPLPPFSNEFGRIQRRLAKNYQVHLIPKRIFVSVLTTDGATVDQVHLSRYGHELMAQTVWSLIQRAYAKP